jgi:hypothetical protein
MQHLMAEFARMWHNVVIRQPMTPILSDSTKGVNNYEEKTFSAWNGGSIGGYWLWDFVCKPKTAG